jgi:hypothetical protein
VARPHTSHRLLAHHQISWDRSETECLDNLLGLGRRPVVLGFVKGGGVSDEEGGELQRKGAFQEGNEGIATIAAHRDFQEARIRPAPPSPAATTTYWKRWVAARGSSKRLVSQTSLAGPKR